jgi:hypothetical protein
MDIIRNIYEFVSILNIHNSLVKNLFCRLASYAEWTSQDLPAALVTVYSSTWPKLLR